uniref:ANK_REP_REGION domain-containing protein n=1 Tax=Rhodnius prolixus TaxID=13249 RepID=T1HAG8_RHOPR
MLEEELRAASASGILQDVTSLLKKGAIFSADSCGRTPLHLAAACGHKDIVETLVHPKYINAVDSVGRTPLQIAATGGHVEVVRVLLKNGANPNSRDKLHGNTSLHEASWHGFSQTVALLTGHKATTDVRNSAGFAPLHLACQNGHNQTCRELLLAEANPDIQNNNGDTPLHIAAAMGRRKLTTILLEAGCDKSIRNKRACGSAVRWSPYGCHYYPDPNSFPQPRLDSLPGEPLSKGEQYYLDLAGNIRKGPVGVGLTCYCANFLRDMEARLEKSNSELRKRIRNTRCELEQRVTRTEGLLAEWLGASAMDGGDVRQSRKSIKNSRAQRRRGRSHSLDLLSNTGVEEITAAGHSSRRSSVVLLPEEENKKEKLKPEAAEVGKELLEKVNELTMNEDVKSVQEMEEDEVERLWETATPPFSEIEKLPYRSRVGVYSPAFMGLSDQEEIDNKKNSQNKFCVPENINKISEKSFESQEGHNLHGSNLV